MKPRLEKFFADIDSELNEATKRLALMLAEARPEAQSDIIPVLERVVDSRRELEKMRLFLNEEGA